jgi:hypothetical protein
LARISSGHRYDLRDWAFKRLFSLPFDPSTWLRGAKLRVLGSMYVVFSLAERKYDIQIRRTKYRCEGSHVISANGMIFERRKLDNGG